MVTLTLLLALAEISPTTFSIRIEGNKDGVVFLGDIKLNPGEVYKLKGYNGQQLDCRVQWVDGEELKVKNFKISLDVYEHSTFTFTIPKGYPTIREACFSQPTPTCLRGIGA